MAKNYRLDEAKKKIFADILKLTPKEIEEVEKFRRFGYEVVNKKMTKEEKKRLNDEYILEYLKDFPEKIEEYKAIKEKDAKPKKTNEDEEPTKTRKQGFNAGRNWFAKTFPENIADELVIANKIKENEKKIEKNWKKYNSDNKDNPDKMTEEQYKKYYYWTRIFERE